MEHINKTAELYNCTVEVGKVMLLCHPCLILLNFEFGLLTSDSCMERSSLTSLSTEIELHSWGRAPDEVQ